MIGLRKVNCRLTAAALVLLILPLAAPSAAQTLMAMPVPGVTLYPGDAIATHKLAAKTFRVTAAALQNFASSPEQLAGKFARRTMPAGRPIPFAAVRGREIIEQGKPVVMLFQEDGVSISATVIALQSGELGEIIEARNPDSGLVVRARVTSDGILVADGT